MIEIQAQLRRKQKTGVRGKLRARAGVSVVGPVGAEWLASGIWSVLGGRRLEEVERGPNAMASWDGGVRFGIRKRMLARR
jgi:hypothetical protein